MEIGGRIITKKKLTEDRICTVLREKLYTMADNKNQTTYEPLQLKWELPINSTQGILSVLKNAIFLLCYGQNNNCNEETINKIIENDICPVLRELKDEYDFLLQVRLWQCAVL